MRRPVGVGLIVIAVRPEHKAVLDDLPVPVGQAVQERPLPVDEAELAVKDAGGEVVVVDDVPEVGREPVVVPEGDDALAAYVHGEDFPVRVAHPPEVLRDPVPQLVRQEVHPPVIQVRRVGMAADCFHFRHKVTVSPLNSIRSGCQNRRGSFVSRLR